MRRTLVVLVLAALALALTFLAPRAGRTQALCLDAGTTGTLPASVPALCLPLL
jgi:hypothetical protein